VSLFGPANQEEFEAQPDNPASDVVRNPNYQKASELRNEDVENGIDVPPTKSVYMIQ